MSGAYVCTACGTVGAPRSQASGSFGLELILWCLFILPGLIYSISRLASRVPVCPACGRKNTMIPVNSPRGRQLTA